MKPLRRYNSRSILIPNGDQYIDAAWYQYGLRIASNTSKALSLLEDLLAKPPSRIRRRWYRTHELKEMQLEIHIDNRRSPTYGYQMASIWTAYCVRFFQDTDPAEDLACLAQIIEIGEDIEQMKSLETWWYEEYIDTRLSLVYRHHMLSIWTSDSSWCLQDTIPAEVYACLAPNKNIATWSRMYMLWSILILDEKQYMDSKQLVLLIDNLLVHLIYMLNPAEENEWSVFERPWKTVTRSFLLLRIHSN